MWSVTLNGVDITAKVAQVSVTFSAENVAGECTVELADRSVLDGIVVPRVPREMLVVVDKGDGSAPMEFFLESVDYPQDLTAKTATIWGRSASAGLYLPWAQKISKQWQTATTVDAIIQELADPCGVTVTVENDYDVGAYTYAVSDQYPSEIVQDLATRSGQILWPQPDGSLVIAPRIYPATGYGTPDVTLDAAEIVVDLVERDVPDFGNRVLVSGDGAVAGLSVTVVPVYTDDACVPADGESTLRLVAVVVGSDGAPVEAGTVVTWSATAGAMDTATSATGVAMVTGEVQRATSFQSVTLDLPAASVVGVYPFGDARRARNLYTEREGSVSGRQITFGLPLDFFDQALIIDYDVAAATNEWTAGFVPGDVTIIASVAGAQGQCVVHQSNPSACASQINLEAVPSSPCIGDSVAILATVGMFGGPGVGPAEFSMSGCGRLSSRIKTLSTHEINEELRTTTWGGVSQVRLSAYPADDGIDIHLPGSPGTNLYASHDGRTVNLTSVLPGSTTVEAVYDGAGTALVSWIPDGEVDGEILIYEELVTTDDGANSFVELTHAPTAGVAEPVLMITESPTYRVPPDLYGSHDAETVTLNTRLDAGSTVYCTYWTDQPLQPDCSATISVHVQDGSQDGGRGTIKVTARDCRTQTTDPSLPPDDTSPDDPPGWPVCTLPDIETACETGPINDRTPPLNGMNWEAVAGVETAAECPGQCTCDQICTALRNTGRLAKAGYFWSQCVAECEAARLRKCGECDVTGPETLEAGTVGTWDDGRGNGGEYSGGLEFISQSESGGYVLRMPTGGEGPFELKFCYDRTDDSCCTAEVDFPPCELVGPTQLLPDQEGAYYPSRGMDGAAVYGTMQEVRRTADGVTMRLPDGQCTGWVAVSYGGDFCARVDVVSALTDDINVADGPSTLLLGETGEYDYSFPGGYLGDLEYIGTMELVSAYSGGAVLRMPEDAVVGQTYTAAWSASCGRVATLAVSNHPVCDTMIPATGSGSPVGQTVRIPAQQLSGVPMPEVCGVVTSTVVSGLYLSCSTNYDTWTTQRCWEGVYEGQPICIYTPPAVDGQPCVWQAAYLITGVFE